MPVWLTCYKCPSFNLKKVWLSKDFPFVRYKLGFEYMFYFLVSPNNYWCSRRRTSKKRSHLLLCRVKQRQVLAPNMFSLSVLNIWYARGKNTCWESPQCFFDHPGKWAQIIMAPAPCGPCWPNKQRDCVDRAPLCKWWLLHLMTHDCGGHVCMIDCMCVCGLAGSAVGPRGCDWTVAS